MKSKCKLLVFMGAATALALCLLNDKKGKDNSCHKKEIEDSQEKF